MTLPWHKTAVSGQIVAYHLAAVDRKAKRLLKRMKKETDNKELEKMEFRYDLYLTKITFLTNALTGCQRQRLAEREFDEWMVTLNDLKATARASPRLLETPSAV